MQQQLEAAGIQHLLREGLYGTLSAECNRLRQRRGDDAALLLWRGCALGFQVRATKDTRVQHFGNMLMLICIARVVIAATLE
jgi:hypothetical protein